MLVDYCLIVNVFFADILIINRENKHSLIFPILQKFKIGHFRGYFLSWFKKKTSGSQKRHQRRTSTPNYGGTRRDLNRRKWWGKYTNLETRRKQQGSKFQRNRDEELFQIRWIQTCTLHLEWCSHILWAKYVVFIPLKYFWKISSTEKIWSMEEMRESSFSQLIQ